MARHNFVFLYGKVESTPTIVSDTNGNFKKAKCQIRTIHGNRSTDDDTFGNYKYECPTIITENPDIIFEISKWKVGDMVEVKGTVTTKAITKTTTCPQCGKKNSVNGVLTYVTPVYCSMIEHAMNEDISTRLLMDKCEISNQCIVAGNVCSDPHFYRNSDNTCEAQYQLALNRKLRIKEDPPEIKTDFPWVKSKGENAKNDASFLVKGSSVLVEGYLHVREYPRTTVCETCGKEYKWKDNTLEIVPYYTEYLLNTRSPEEIEQIQNEEGDAIFESLFGNPPPQ